MTPDAPAKDSALSSIPNRWLRLGLGLVAAIPLCAACLAGGSPDEPQPLNSLREFPPLAFAQYSVDFGEVPPMPVIDAHFDFVNRSDAAIEIVGFRPSCNCLNPQLLGNRRDYAPGEAGRFHIQVETTKEPAGPQDYVVEMDYRAADNRVYTEAVIFRVTLPELKVTVEPSELLFYQLSGEAGSQTIHITDHRETPLTVSEVTCDSPYASFEVGDPEVDEHGRSTITIQINIAEGIPPMREITLINIHTSDPEFSQLKVPMLIHGPVQSQDILPASSAVPAPLPVDSTDASPDDDGEQKP